MNDMRFFPVNAGQPYEGLAPEVGTAYWLFVQSIDPQNNRRDIVQGVKLPTLDAGIRALEEELKRRHKDGWFIWRIGWCRFTCVLYDGVTCKGAYLNVVLEAATIAAN